MPNATAQPRQRALGKWLREEAKGDRPVFLCIAANGFWCGATEAVEVIEDEVKKRNKTSAFFVITWPKTQQICYYAAGDGNKLIEQVFADTEVFHYDNENKIGTLAAKATHHGALTAFNQDFFKELSPEKYIVSAGKQYGHPSKCQTADL